MDLRKLKSLIDLVSNSDISELEISEGDDRVRIVKAKSKEKNQLKNINTTSDLARENTDEGPNSYQFDDETQKTIMPQPFIHDTHQRPHFN